MTDVGLSNHITEQGVPRSLRNLVANSHKYYWPVLISKAGYKGNNGKIGYSIQGLVAKVKDTAANG